MNLPTATMPTILLERLPLPSLQTYISMSVLFLGLATFYAHQTVTAKIRFDPVTQIEEELGLSPELTNLTLPYNEDNHFLNMLYVMRVETWCIWTLVNSCYCVLILLGKLIQNIVFGELRVSEQQHLKDKFWNFVFYKFIFIFGVMNVQSMDEVVLWVAWFSALGFLHLLTQLSKDRFEYLSFSPATPRTAHIKLLTLLFTILTLCGVLMAGCIWAGFNISFTIFAFLTAESLLLLLKCLYVIVRYVIQLWDMSLEGVWEGRAIFVYYTELTFELVALSVDFAHHLHMLLYGNIFLSMASLVICMQLRFLFYEFQRRLRRHKNYLRVVKDMESKFPMATQENLEQNADDCAICWEKMESARKLPCGHLFHNSCLRSWLEQDTACPTCRTTLSETREREAPGARPPGGVANVGEVMVAPPNQGTTNHFFHFDGSRYVSWLPSFSVEVTHTNLLSGQQAHATQTSQLDNMVREVMGVFPNIPQSVIMDDMRITRSIDLTIDNILEGRVTAPTVSLNAAGHERSGSSDFSYGALNLMESSESQQNSPLPVLSATAAVPTPGPQLFPTLPPESLSQPQLPSVNHDLQPDELPLQSRSQPLVLGGAEHSSQQRGPNAMTGGRFSKSATERMAMLDQRKKAMVEQARRSYELKQQNLMASQATHDFAATSDSNMSLGNSSVSVSGNYSWSSTDNDLDTSSCHMGHTENTSTNSNSAHTSSDTDSGNTHVVSGNIAAEEQVRKRALLLEATQRRLERRQWTGGVEPSTE